MKAQPRSLRRLILTRVLPAIGLVIVLVAALIAWRVWSRMKGPPPPQCAEQALPHRTFLPAQQLSSAQTPGARLYDIEPAAALMPDGALVVAWNALDSIFAQTTGLVTARIGLAGETSLRPYPADRRAAFDSWMAVGPDGKARMVWLGHDGGSPERNMKIGYAESSDGLSYTPPLSIHAPADWPEGSRGGLDKPMIAAGPAGVYVAYCSDAGEGLRVVHSELAQPQFGSSVKAGEGCYGDILVSPSGTLHLVFVDQTVDRKVNQFGDSAFRVAYTRSTDGGKTFAVPTAVSTADEQVPFYFSNPQVAADEQRGFLYVAWPSGTPDGRWDIYLATSADGGKSWSRRKVNDDAHCASHMTPHTALDPKTGVLHITWLDNRSGVGALAYASCAPGGSSCSANEAVSDKPFASYTYERHLPGWLAEYGTLLIDSERRWLHAVWTQPVLENNKPISRIFHARAKLP